MSNLIPLPGCSLELSEGEVVVRCYHITNTKKPKARGDVAVTNKRIIYQGKGKSSTAVTEVPIESVSGIGTYYGSGWNLGRLLLGIIIIIAGFAMFFLVFPPIIGTIIGVLMIFSSYNSGYSLSIKSSGVTGVGIAVGSSDISVTDGSFLKDLFSTSGQGAALAKNASPTIEAIQMMNELGAIVMDLKTIGDRAIEKWSGHQSAPIDMSTLNAKLSDSLDFDFGGIKDAAAKVQSGIQRNHQPFPEPVQNPVNMNTQTQNIPIGMTPPPPPPPPVPGPIQQGQPVQQTQTAPPPPPPPPIQQTQQTQQPQPNPNPRNDDRGFFG